MKTILMVAITVLAMGCEPLKKDSINFNIIDYKAYVKSGFLIDTKMPDGICVYGLNHSLNTFQDSCNKYQIGDTIK